MLEDRKARIHRVMDEFYNQGNVDGLEELYAPNIVRVAPPLVKFEGLEDVKKSMAGLFDIYSDIEFTTGKITCEGDTCTTPYRVEMTHTGYHPMVDLQGTGKRVSIEACILSQWEGGKIVREQIYADYLGLFQQLGAMPRPREN